MEFTSILVAFLVVGGVALIAGVLLAVISHFFSVEDDPVFKKIRSCLPGINCGACGYSGCDDYANALARGEAKPNLCTPGGQDVANAVSELLGVEAEAFNDRVAFVHCNGNCEATGLKANYDGVPTCKAASMLYAGPHACRFGCLGLGDCAAVCPSEAICCEDGIAHVNTARCIGCGLCAKTCPKQLISMLPQQATAVVMCNNQDKGAVAIKVCKNACIGCKKCEKNCEFEAISVQNNLATINYEKCTGCGTCVSACPTGCLKSVRFLNLGEAE